MELPSPPSEPSFQVALNEQTVTTVSLRKVYPTNSIHLTFIKPLLRERRAAPRCRGLRNEKGVWLAVLQGAGGGEEVSYSDLMSVTVDHVQASPQ